MAKEQLDTAERDSMIDAALAGQNAKRDAELAARMAARKQLLLEVTQGQMEQIQQHQRARYIWASLKYKFSLARMSCTEILYYAQVCSSCMQFRMRRGQCLGFRDRKRGCF